MQEILGVRKGNEDEPSNRSRRRPESMLTEVLRDEEEEIRELDKENEDVFSNRSRELDSGEIEDTAAQRASKRRNIAHLRYVIFIHIAPFNISLDCWYLTFACLFLFTCLMLTTLTASGRRAKLIEPYITVMVV